MNELRPAESTTQERPACTIENVPDELMIDVFGYLNPLEALKARNVCRQWNALLIDNHLWNLFLYRDFDHCGEGSEIEKSRENYKHCHILRSNLVKGVYKRHTLKGHTGDVCAIKYHNGLLYSSSHDHSIKVWDLSTKTCIHTLAGHVGEVSSLVFDNERLYSASYDETIKVWDLSTNTCSHTLQGHTNVVTSLICADGVPISSSRDNTIRSWNDIDTDVHSTTLVEHIGISLPIIHADGKLVSTSSEYKLKIWDVRTGACLNTLEGNPTWATSFLYADKLLFVGYWDGQIEMWSLKTQTLLHAFKGHDDTIRSLVFADGFLISSSIDGTIKFWKGRGEFLHTIEGAKERILTLDYANGRLFVGYAGGEIEIIDFNKSAASKQTEESALNNA